MKWERMEKECRCSVGAPMPSCPIPAGHAVVVTKNLALRVTTKTIEGIEVYRVEMYSRDSYLETFIATKAQLIMFYRGVDMTLSLTGKVKVRLMEVPT